jgi:two-component system sensor histidine kinase and response regulator WspE
VLSAPHLVATVHGRELRLNAGASRRAEVRRKRVLVVDDSPLTRELLVQLLESAGYQVVQATDGAHALDVLARETADIVVTDLEMPTVDGLELTRRLKAHATWRSLPVVIVTTRGGEADRKRGMEAGADGYVTKGDLVRQDLVDVVGRLLA